MNFRKPLIAVFLILGLLGCTNNAPTPKTLEKPTAVEVSTMDEKVFYESSDLKLTAKNLEIKDTTSVFNFHGESFTETTLQIEFYISSINGYSVEPVSSIFNLNFLCNEDFRLSFFNEDLLNHYIQTIYEMEFIINIYELDDEFEVTSSLTLDPISIKTKEYKKENPNPFEGLVVYNQQDIRVIQKEEYSEEMTFYFENNTDHPVSIVYKFCDQQNDRFAYVVNLGAHKKAFRNIFVPEEPENLELYLGIEDLETSDLLDSTRVPVQR